MKNRRLATLALAILAALALTGCDRGGSVGVGSTTSQSQSQSASQDLSQTRALGDRQDKTQAVSIPFPTLAVPALLGEDAAGVTALGTMIIRSPEPVGEADVPGSFPPSPPPQFNPQIAREAALSSGWPIALAFHKMADGKWAEGVDLQKKARMLAMISAATQPGTGWPVSVKGAATPLGGAEPEAFHHAENMAVAACFTSRTLARIHQNLPKGALFKSPEELRERVRETYLGLPLPELEGNLKACREHLHGTRITFNFSGVQGQEWRIDDLSITRDARGTTFTKNGAAWFGDGLAEGKRLEVTASHAITAEMVMAAGNTRSSDAKSGQETSGSVGVGK